MRKSRLTSLTVMAVIVSLTAFFLAAGADEGELLRQIKSEVFDQQWTAVLASCDQFIAQFPRSATLPRAYYYKAQALEHIKGREVDAIAAYTDFMTRFPGETGALKEDAILSRLSMASSLWIAGNRTQVGVIIKGMDESGYPRTYSAIQASKIDHAPARAKALPILKECAERETDVEVKNECVLALLRIDPKSTTELRQPAPPRPGGRPPSVPGAPAPPNPPGAGPAGEAKLIRVEVYDKIKKQVSVRVNMPVAFAQLLLDSLNDELRNEISHGLQAKGLQLDRFWEAFKKGGKQTIVEIDDAEQHIKVWIE